MSKPMKKTGLANFTPSKAVPAGEAAPSEQPSPSARTNKEEKPRLKQFPVRLTVNQWRHLKDLATFEEKTLVQLTFEGYNMLLKSKGMKTLDEI